MSDNRKRQLIQAYIRNEMLDEDFALFQEMLRSDVEVRRDLMTCLTIEDELRGRAHAESLTEAWTDPERDAPMSTAPRRLVPILKWAAAAVLLIAVWGVSRSFRPETGEAVMPAQINRGAGIVFAGHPDLGVGDNIGLGKFDLVQGVIQIRFASGAEVNMEAPVRFRVEGTNALYLESGCAMAAVPTQAKGFRIETGRCVATDLGTEFGVAVAPDSVDVLVFQGQVKLEVPRSHAEQCLATGEGRRVNASRVSKLKAEEHASRFIHSVPLTGAVRAGTNLVRNHSFEIGALSRSPNKRNGQYRNTPTGWEHVMRRNDNVRSAADHHGGTSLAMRNEPALVPPHGERFIWVNHGEFQQQLNAVLQPRTRYAVTASVGTHPYWGDGGVKDAVNRYSIQLWAGETKLHEVSGTLAAGTAFHDVGFAFSAPADHPALGQPLKIVLAAEFKVNFDNIRVIPTSAF